MARYFVLAAMIGVLAACATTGPRQLTEEQICRNHYENDPAERDRCSVAPELRSGSPPQARPEDLPIRTGNPGG